VSNINHRIQLVFTVSRAYYLCTYRRYYVIHLVYVTVNVCRYLLRSIVFFRSFNKYKLRCLVGEGVLFVIISWFGTYAGFWNASCGDHNSALLPGIGMGHATMRNTYFYVLIGVRCVFIDVFHMLGTGESWQTGVTIDCFRVCGTTITLLLCVLGGKRAVLCFAGRSITDHAGRRAYWITSGTSFIPAALTISFSWLWCHNLASAMVFWYGSTIR
jgi:hypothetical protein